MKALYFEIDLLSPVLLAQLNRNDPNSRISFNYLPGSVLRGMLIEQYRHNYPTLATDDTFRRLFLDGTVRFLHAYPQAPEWAGRRMLPTPLSWKQEKDLDEAHEKPLFDFAIQEEGIEPDRSKTWQTINAPFSAIWTDESHLDEGDDQDLDDLEFKTEEWQGPSHHYIVKSPKIQVNIHNARGERERTTAEGSTVFRYDALAPDQTFCGWVLAEEEQALLTIAELFQAASTMIIGRSHSAGYGRIRARANVQVEDSGSGWREYKPMSLDSSEKLVVTLLSDAVLRDPETGAYATDLSPLLPGRSPEVAYTRTGIAGGFNRTGNLPLCQVQTIQAGSVFVYKYEAGLAQQLEQLAISGIGERQAEGFGRLAVNWQGAYELDGLKHQPESRPDPIPLTEQSVDFAQQMLKRMLRTQLDEKLLERINHHRLNRNGMTNTQLSRLRTAARACLEQKSEQEFSLDPLRTLLKDMKQTARQQFQAAMIHGLSFEQWLKKQIELDMSEEFWSDWGIKQSKLPTIGDQQAKREDILAQEYTVRFIDGVAKKARKGAEHEGQQ